MNLIDLKRPKKKNIEGKDIVGPSIEEGYPYELRITLEEEELNKLDLDIGSFVVGDKVPLYCEAKVIAIRQSANETSNQGTRTRKSIEFQITKMHVEKPKTKKKIGFKEFNEYMAKGPGG